MERSPFRKYNVAKFGSASVQIYSANTGCSLLNHSLKWIMAFCKRNSKHTNKGVFGSSLNPNNNQVIAPQYLITHQLCGHTTARTASTAVPCGCKTGQRSYSSRDRRHGAAATLHGHRAPEATALERLRSWFNCSSGWAKPKIAAAPFPKETVAARSSLIFSVRKLAFQPHCNPDPPLPEGALWTAKGDQDMPR